MDEAVNIRVIREPPQMPQSSPYEQYVWLLLPCGVLSPVVLLAIAVLLLVGPAP